MTSTVSKKDRARIDTLVAYALAHQRRSVKTQKGKEKTATELQQIKRVQAILRRWDREESTEIARRLDEATAELQAADDAADLLERRAKTYNPKPPTPSLVPFIKDSDRQNVFTVKSWLAL